MDGPSHRRRRKSSLLDTQNELVRRASTVDNDRGRCLTRMSWYQDALLQQLGSEADLRALLLDETGSSSIPVEETNQVAEQHRILAIHKARSLLEERLGRPFQAPKKLELTAHDRLNNRRPTRPSCPQKLALPKPNVTLGERQTCLIPPNVPIRIDKNADDTAKKNPILIDTTDEPDIQMGMIVPAGSTATRGTIVLYCAACPQLLPVSLKATLVRCPQCRELSPASDAPILAEFS